MVAVARGRVSGVGVGKALWVEREVEREVGEPTHGLLAQKKKAVGRLLSQPPRNLQVHGEVCVR